MAFDLGRLVSSDDPIAQTVTGWPAGETAEFDISVTDDGVDAARVCVADRGAHEPPPAILSEGEDRTSRSGDDPAA